MNLPAPRLDDREFDDLVEEARRRIAARCPEWTDFNYSDPGMVLVELMAWMTETVLYRLNRVPDLNYIRFLDLMGVRLRPAKPARTHVFFQVTPGPAGGAARVVRRGTRVSTRPEDGRDPVPFVTLHDLSVTGSRIVRIASRFGVVDGGGSQREVVHDLGALATRPAAIFDPDEGLAVRHHWYLGDPRLGVPQARNLQVTIEVEQPAKTGFFLEWEAWDGEDWRTIVPDADTTDGLMRGGAVRFSNLPVLAKAPAVKLTRLALPPPLDPRDKDEDAYWIRARWVGAGGDDLPLVRRVSYQIGVTGCPFAPRRALAGVPAPEVAPGSKHPQPVPVGPALLPLEFNQEFEPFGPKPTTDSAFYLESELFQRQGATLRIEFRFRPGTTLRPRDENRENLKVRWEYRAADRTWRTLGECDPTAVTRSEFGLQDGTLAFTRDGLVEFTCPEDLAYAQVQVTAEPGWFVRARLERAELVAEAPALRVRQMGLGFTEIPASGSRRQVPGQVWRYGFAENYARLKRHDPKQPFAPFEREPSLDPTFFVALDERPAAGRHPYRLFVDVARPDAAAGDSEEAWEYDLPAGDDRFLCAGDFADATGFIERLTRQSDPLLRFLWAGLPEDLQNHLREPGPVSPELARQLAEALNRLLAAGPLYEASRFAGVPLSAKSRQLLARNPRGRDLARLNRLLLADAFPGELAFVPRWRWRRSDAAAGAAEPRMVWEYALGGNRWRGLEPRDGTDGFAHAGMLEFLSPGDWASDEVSGTPGYWLRVRWEAGNTRFPIRLRGLFLNGVEVEQSLRQERVLGTSDGSPDQSFSLHTEILDAPEVWVGQPTAHAESAAGSTDVARADSSREALGAWEWVKWTEVPNFHRSTTDVAGGWVPHFRVDLGTGTFRFGDGISGAVPPAGARIRVVFRTNAGAAGNVGPQTITVIDDPLEGIQSVSNPHPAEGGFDRETLDEARVRGPWEMKHRGRAVTQEDFEALALRASPLVGKASCFAQDGIVHVVIVPVDTGDAPQPSRRLVEAVTEYLSTRTLINTRVVVEGPDYETVDLDVGIVLTPAARRSFAEIRTQVEARLRRFVHPLDGLADGSGWPMGRALHLSELYYCLEGIEGIDHVATLRMCRAGGVPSGETRIRISERAFPRFSRQLVLRQVQG